MFNNSPKYPYIVPRNLYYEIKDKLRLFIVIPEKGDILKEI